jgi:cytochrome c oxidase subunit 2
MSRAAMKPVGALLLLAAARLAGAAPVVPAQSALEPAGIQAARIHDLWLLTLGICSLVFAAVLAALLLALWRSSRSTAATPADVTSLVEPEPRIKRSVLVAVGVSTLLLFGLVLADVQTDRLLGRMPLTDAVHVELTAHQWWWEARYDDAQPAKIFTTANEMHIPVGRPVIMTLKSNDVIHTFWLPSLHGKKDMIPGRTSLIRLRADQAGTYRGQCAEFCGMEHAMMAFLVTAEENDKYEAWADSQRHEASNVLDAQQSRGRQVFMERSCVMCHTVQGTGANAVLGPDLTHVASRRTLASGVLPNNRQQLAAWITQPQKLKPGTNMPATPLSAEELDSLLAFIDTLK